METQALKATDLAELLPPVKESIWLAKAAHLIGGKRSFLVLLDAERLEALGLV